MLNIGMKRIGSLLTAVTTLILIGAMINVGSTSGSTRLYVDPPRVTGLVDNTFTVDIMVEDVEDLFTWQIYMFWDSSALTCNEVYFGDFMDQPRYGSGLGLDSYAGWDNVTVKENMDYFEVGMSVVIHDDYNSENNVISSISGYALYLATPLTNDYTVAAHGQVDTYPGTSPGTTIKTGSVMTGEMTSKPASGAYGSGWLATIEFQVLSATETALDMSSAYPDYTYFIDHNGLDILPIIVEDGRFIPAPPEDLNGDGWIDIFDLCQVAIHYGETGTPGWIPEDFTGPTPYEPDGVVDLRELTAICLKYGSSV